MVVHVYCLDIKKLSADFIEKQSKIISDDRKKKIMKLFREKDKICSIASELLSIYSLKKNSPDCLLEFSKNNYGKPYLVNNEELFFNVSHSGDKVICGVAKQRIGVDIELIESAPLEVTKYFSIRERINILKNRTDDCFYLYWTMKESYIKYIGKGLSIPLDSFEVSPIYSEGTFEVVGLCEGAEAVGHFFEIDSEYIMSVCLKEKERIEVVHICIDELTRTIDKMN